MKCQAYPVKSVVYQARKQCEVFAECLSEVRIEQGVIEMALRGEALRLPVVLNWLGPYKVLSIHPSQCALASLVVPSYLIISPVSRNGGAFGQNCFLVVTHIDTQNSTCQNLSPQ